MKKANHTENLGKKFGRLTIKEVIQKGKYYYYNCICDCGNGCTATSFTILKGQQVSCGCFQKEAARKRLLGKPGPGRKPEGEPSFRYLLNTYKRNAKKRNIEFNLTELEFKLITQSKCYFCGCNPDRPVKYHTVKRNKDYPNYYLHNGIDRLDNNIGYTFKNSVPCCKTCNVAKSTQTREEFLRWVKKVAEFNGLF